jgi:hypothetical protein
MDVGKLWERPAIMMVCILYRTLHTRISGAYAEWVSEELIRWF